MVSERPAILQVVGYQNSGKTTLVKELITELRTENYRTVTIKHHGHGGKPDGIEGKDSTAHLHAGAVATIVEGNGGLLLQAEKESWDLNEQLQLLDAFHPDVILIEGYKHENYPKVVILRSVEDQGLLSLSNVVAVVVCDHDDATRLHSHPYEMFSRTERTVIPFLLNYLVEQLR